MLEDISVVSSGGTPNRSKLGYWGGDIPWVSTSLIDFNTIYQTEEKITEEGLQYSSAKICPKGSLLMAMYGQGKTRGKVAMLGIDASINQACASIQTDKRILNSSFLFQNLSKRYLEIRNLSNQGGQENLSGTIIKSINVSYPSLSEQEKIVSFFILIDQRIEAQNKIIKDLKLLKSTIRHILFMQIEKSNTERKRIKDILDYEQPTMYIVENTDYQSDVSLIPVLTANKAFILGYTSENYGIYNKGNCIIFDDFTLDLKYVDFPFKVKSSAIKILTSKPSINLKYVFEYLSFLDLTSRDHKRHYISEVESMLIYVPEIEMQDIFSILFSILDEKIVLESHHYNLLTTQKQYLLSQLFI